MGDIMAGLASLGQHLFIGVLNAGLNDLSEYIEKVGVSNVGSLR